MHTLVRSSLLLCLTGGALAAPLPSTTPAFFAGHRDALLSRLPAGAIAVFHSAAEFPVEVDHLYRQDSDLWYVTGVAEPEVIAILRPNAADGKRFILFVRPREFKQEQWTGWRAGLDGAKSQYAADDAFPIAEFGERFRKLAAGSTALYYRDGGDAKFREQLLGLWALEDANATQPRPVADAGAIVHQMRLVKDPTEQALMRYASALSAEAHRKAMAQVKPGHYEYDLDAAMIATCRAGGAARMAYPPIVGSGRNSVILHYEANSKRLEAGDMIVNDTACEYEMYSSDVTRSYPVSGRFSADQRAIYEIVLAAQKAAMAAVRPGIAFRDVHAASVEVVVDGLMRLGILSGDRAEIIEKRAFQQYYPHGCSHWMGLNVHDVGSYGYPEGLDRLERYGKAMTKLEPGMAFSVEPGIYIPENAAADKRWWNIGVRIEDTVLVTSSGVECLSCAAPREIADVEKAIAGR